MIYEIHTLDSSTPEQLKKAMDIAMTQIVEAGLTGFEFNKITSLGDESYNLSAQKEDIHINIKIKLDNHKREFEMRIK